MPRCLTMKHMNTTTPSTPAPQPPATAKRLVRSSDRMVGGVAAGVADYVGIDVSIVRLAFVALTVFGGSGPLVYLAGWLIVPDAEATTPPPPAPPAATGATGAAAGPQAPAPSPYAEDDLPA